MSKPPIYSKIDSEQNFTKHSVKSIINNHIGKARKDSESTAQFGVPNSNLPFREPLKLSNAQSKS
jgi:hypothetical protein